MNNISNLILSGRKWLDLPHAQASPEAVNGRIGIGWPGKLWSGIAGPFHRSIYVRFQYVFGLAILGLVLMAAITVISGNLLLNTYDNSVSDTQADLTSFHQIQKSLRQAERLTDRYAIEGDYSAPVQFKKQQEVADRYFQQLAENELLAEADEHAGLQITFPETIKAWQDAQNAILKVFQQPAGSPEAMTALLQSDAAISSVDGVIAEFQAFSMKDLEARLRFAHSVARWAYLAMFAAILVGLGLLIVTGLVVGRSVLQPIGGLQEAARKLGEKDFSHRVKLRNTSDELGQLGKAFNLASATIQRAYLELKRRSTHDGLTGAVNRGEFEDRLIAECKSADRNNRPLTLLMVDVDYFKRINDSHGHPVGDRALQTVARLLNETMRPGDLVARYGGEEFAIILPETGGKSAIAAAERLRKTIEKASIDGGAGMKLRVTVSVGCAVRHSKTMAPEDLVRSADTALYRAKETGRNRVVTAGKLSHTRSAGRQTAVA